MPRPSLSASGVSGKGHGPSSSPHPKTLLRLPHRETWGALGDRPCQASPSLVQLRKQQGQGCWVAQLWGHRFTVSHVTVASQVVKCRACEAETGTRPSHTATPNQDLTPEPRRLCWYALGYGGGEELLDGQMPGGSGRLGVSPALRWALGGIGVGGEAFPAEGSTASHIRPHSLPHPAP